MLWGRRTWEGRWFLRAWDFWPVCGWNGGVWIFVEVTADRLVRECSLGTACFGVPNHHMPFMGPVGRARWCAPEGIPSAAVLFVEVTREPHIPGHDVWLVVLNNMWRPEQAAAMFAALQGHAVALPRVPAAKALATGRWRPWRFSTVGCGHGAWSSWR